MAKARHSKWIEIGQDKIDVFADVTEDWQFIHIDAEKAKQTPFGGTVAARLPVALHAVSDGDGC